ncbi:MAG: hypothetical protein HYX24_04135 [Candidatus Aenigmarchaeota archaeon]|nr:hypothetical protein [Candidatus Aenigmarchaeota archaeon]
MTSYRLEGAMKKYRELERGYKKMMEEGGPEQSAWEEHAHKVVADFTKEVLALLNPETRALVHPQPKYTAVFEIPKLKRPLKMLYTDKHDNPLASVPVGAYFGDDDITVTFHRSSQEVANKITGALYNEGRDVSPPVSKSPE